MRTGCGLIFDMDELLVDSRAVWRAAETKLLNSMGRPYDPELARQYQGLNANDLAATVYRVIQPDGPLARYQQIMREAIVAAYADGDVLPMPGAVELARRLAGLAPMAVASGSPEAGIEKAMTRLGIREVFAVILSSESVARGKPCPDVFLEAARRLGATPARCLVFEDSIFGVKAARAAGMHVFAVPSLHRQATAQLASRTFASLSEVTVDHVRSALSADARAG